MIFRQLFAGGARVIKSITRLLRCNSVGTIDRVSVERSQKVMSSGTPYTAGGRGSIDPYRNQTLATGDQKRRVPAMKPARIEYRALSSDFLASSESA
jgi:hypothetical protein